MSVKPCPPNLKDKSGIVGSYGKCIGYVRMSGRFPHWLFECKCGRSSVGQWFKGRLDNPCRWCRQYPDRHEHYGTPEYKAWINMRQRCTNKRHPKYDIYGGRGIGIVAAWDDFQQFLSDMGKRPEGHSLDRIDGSGDYGPDNCRWATMTVQNNNRSNCRTYEFQQTRGTLSHLVKLFSQRTDSCVRKRLSRGWSLERALTT